jgi:hypothetical protein
MFQRNTGQLIRIILDDLGHDHRFGQVGANSFARVRDCADESAPTNGNKKKAPLETGRNDDHGHDLNPGSGYYFSILRERGIIFEINSRNYHIN